MSGLIKYSSERINKIATETDMLHSYMNVDEYINKHTDEFNKTYVCCFNKNLFKVYYIENDYINTLYVDDVMAVDSTGIFKSDAQIIKQLIQELERKDVFDFVALNTFYDLARFYLSHANINQRNLELSIKQRLQITSELTDDEIHTIFDNIGFSRQTLHNYLTTPGVAEYLTISYGLN